jgi:hypothetical protein
VSCPDCGGPLEPQAEPRNLVITPEPGVIRVEVQPIGTVVESPVDHPEGRHVDYRPATGGQSVSEMSAGGDFTADLSGPLVFGRPGESRAVEVLVHALREEGRRVERLSGERDDAGEDRLIRIAGRRMVVQVVTMPADSVLWRQFRNDSAALSHSGDQRAAVELFRAALKRKEHAKGDIVVLDAAHFAALAWRKLVDAYLATHSSPIDEFGFADAWIVGPTVRSSIRIRAAGAP